METNQIMMFALQTVTTIIVAIVGWAIKGTFAEMKDSIKKNNIDMEKLKTEFHELKSDLPLIYVLREDFIRTLNNVDDKMGSVNDKLDKIILSNSNGRSG